MNTLDLDGLRSLGSNWDGRGSMAPTPQALRTAGALCACPLGSGGIQIDLHAGGSDIEIEIDAGGNITSVLWAKASRS
jgi:hypothetical protein